MKRYDCHVGEYFERVKGEFIRFEDHKAEATRDYQALSQAAAQIARNNEEIERLRQYEPLKGGVPVREWALREALREVYEIWAGSDGMVPETAPEAYQERLILQMRDAAAKGLGITPPEGHPTGKRG